MNSKLVLCGLFVSSIAWIGCGGKKSQPSEENKEEVEQTDPSMQSSAAEETTLKEELEATQAAFSAKADEEIKALYEEGINVVRESGALANAKKAGDQAPDFTLKNALKEDVSLGEYLKKGPVILTWYRGGWCPYCNLTLKHLQQDLAKFQAEGATLIALTPELPDKSMSTKEKNQLEFEVLTDMGNKVGKEYGIVYKLMDKVADNYMASFDMHGYNGDTSNELPAAATYVIDPSGTIRYAFVEADYRKRAEPADILEALKQIK